MTAVGAVTVVRAVSRSGLRVARLRAAAPRVAPTRVATIPVAATRVTATRVAAAGAGNGVSAATVSAASTVTTAATVTAAARVAAAATTVLRRDWCARECYGEGKDQSRHQTSELHGPLLYSG